MDLLSLWAKAERALQWSGVAGPRMEDLAASGKSRMMGKRFVCGGESLLALSYLRLRGDGMILIEL